MRPQDDGGLSVAATIGLAGGIVALLVLVVLLVVALSPASTSHESASSTPGTPSTSAFAAAASSITHVPASTLDSVGIGGKAASSQTTANPLNLATGTRADLPKISGKPVLFFFGAEWCPFCAAERWSLIIAVSRFGELKGLEPAASSANDYAPNTQTFSLRSATYVSSYLALASVEVQDENKNTLQNPNAAETKVLKAWDPAGEFPFIDLAGRYIGGLPAWDDPLAMTGMSRTAIAAAANDANSRIGATIDANANYLTAGICAVDGGRPAAVCTSPAVAAAARELTHVPDALPFTG